MYICSSTIIIGHTVGNDELFTIWSLKWFHTFDIILKMEFLPLIENKIRKNDINSQNEVRKIQRYKKKSL